MKFSVEELIGETQYLILDNNNTVCHTQICVHYQSMFNKVNKFNKNVIKYTFTMPESPLNLLSVAMHVLWTMTYLWLWLFFILFLCNIYKSYFFNL